MFKAHLYWIQNLAPLWNIVADKVFQKMMSISQSQTIGNIGPDRQVIDVLLYF